MPPDRPRLVAHLIDEPVDSVCAPLLEALPPEESHFYSSEENIVDRGACESDLLNEVIRRYVFVGGDHSEYIKYFARDDIDQSLWHFVRASEVKAYAGFNARRSHPPDDCSVQNRFCVSWPACATPGRREWHGHEPRDASPGVGRRAEQTQ